MEEAIHKLLKDVETGREAFVLEELQSYMDLKDSANPVWITPVRLRLQEKKDWENKVKEAIQKTENALFKDEDEYGMLICDSTSPSYNEGYSDAIELIKKKLGLE